MDILTVVLSAAAVLASAISAFVASAALAGIKKAQAELQKQTEQQTPGAGRGDSPPARRDNGFGGSRAQRNGFRHG